jgi:shikimate kinase
VNIILCGLPKSGKTTFGKYLASKLQWNFIDTDHLIEKAYEKTRGHFISCRHIFLQEGESFFRHLEKEQIQSIITSSRNVIALGGGSLQDGAISTLLQNAGHVIYLKVPISIVWHRLQQDMPAYLQQQDPQQTFWRLAEQRIPAYENIAHMTIEPDLDDPEEIVRVMMDKVQHGK